jgi:hypothetical protein
MADQSKKDPTPTESAMFSPDRTLPFPTNVRVLGKDLIVTQVKPDDTADDDLGTWNDSTLTVYVKPGQLPIEEIDTLIHEVVHGIDYIMDLGLKERQVRLLGTALAGIFQENPEFAAFVTRRVSRTIK